MNALLPMQQQLEYPSQFGRRHPSLPARDSANHPQEVLHRFSLANPPGKTSADCSNDPLGLGRSAEQDDERRALSPRHVRTQAECGAIRQVRINEQDAYVSSGHGPPSALCRGDRRHDHKIILDRQAPGQSVCKRALPVHDENSARRQGRRRHPCPGCSCRSGISLKAGYVTRLR